jgi:hypothetical protein
MNRFIFISVLIISVFLVSLSLAGIPKMINYQGMLTGSDGKTPVNNGNYAILFSIYNTSSGGSSLWSHTYNLSVTNGLFNVTLGDSSAPINLAFDTTYWLGIKVGGDAELTPRIRLTSVGYAYRTQWSDTSNYARASGGGSGSPWIFRITDGSDTTITTGGRWGIARYGNTLYGNADSTHVNLGVGCFTGTNGQNYKYCTVGGGVGNAASVDYATVGGGKGNTASDYAATVGGGYWNTASDQYATVAGGKDNMASSFYATIGGGTDNTASQDFATVSGGDYNKASGQCASIGGGCVDTATGNSATIAGGAHNTASDFGTTVGGGAYNTASEWYATVPGGYNNSAAGYCSFAAGYRAKALHTGSFVWADSTDADFTSTGANQFLIRASGGVGIGTNNPSRILHIKGDNPRILIEASSMSPEINFKNSDDVGTETWALYKHGTTDDFRFYQNGDKVTIQNSTGNVGIGTTDPGSYKLAVNGSAAKPGGGSWDNFSDIRLKEVKSAYEYGLTEVSKLNPVHYSYKKDNALDLPSDRDFVGLVAQDVQGVIPDAVNKDDKGYLMLNNDPIIWAMLNAIKELKAENEELKKRIEVLESR